MNPAELLDVTSIYIEGQELFTEVVANGIFITALVGLGWMAWEHEKEIINFYRKSHAMPTLEQEEFTRIYSFQENSAEKDYYRLSEGEGQ